VQIAELQDVICRVGNLERIDPEELLGEAGFSSMNALELLLELESAYQVSIPDDRFISARTPRDLFDLMTELRQEQMA
jgi:acyl carrier protein